MRFRFVETLEFIEAKCERVPSGNGHNSPPGPGNPAVFNARNILLNWLREILKSGS